MFRSLKETELFTVETSDKCLSTLLQRQLHITVYGLLLESSRDLSGDGHRHLAWRHPDAFPCNISVCHTFSITCAFPVF